MEEQDKVNPMLCSFYLLLVGGRSFGTAMFPLENVHQLKECLQRYKWNFNITWAKELTKYVRYSHVLLYQGLFHIIFYYYWGEEYHFVIP